MRVAVDLAGRYAAHDGPRMFHSCGLIAGVTCSRRASGKRYRFLRDNRCNLGDDPVATLNVRLGSMIAATGKSGAGDATSVGRIKQQAQAVEHGESKVCSRCKTIKPLADYFDRALASGAGGDGRVCMTCKTPTKPVVAPWTYAGRGGSHGGRRFKRH